MFIEEILKYNSIAIVGSGKKCRKNGMSELYSSESEEYRESVSPLPQ